MNATAAALGGEAIANARAPGGVRMIAPNTDASHTNAVPPPGAVFATQVPEGVRARGEQHERERDAPTRARRGSAACARRMRRCPGPSSQYTS